MNNTVINFMDQGQNFIKVENEADMPQKIDSNNEFPASPRLIT